MSSLFIQRLRAVRNEYDAAREAIAYVNRNWQKHNIPASMTEGLTPKHFTNAAESLEAVFIIRLFSTFEGILKEHLAKNHPGISVPEDARAVWLIDRVSTLQTPHIGTPLRNEVHAVRRYRNFLVHPSGAVAARVILTTHLPRLQNFPINSPTRLIRRRSYFEIAVKLKNRKPTDPEVTARILKRIEEMTPEEVIAFLEYRTPGIEETDMTGMFGRSTKNGHQAAAKRRDAKP